MRNELRGSISTGPILMAVLTGLLASRALHCFQSGVNATSPADESARELVEGWRRRLAEMRALQSRFHGSIVGASLSDLGRVAFVVEQASDLPKSLIDDADYQFIYSAVKGQTPDELEANL